MATRVAFLDVARGVALLLMVVNHTARWWLGDAMEPGRSVLVYASVLVPGALFLLLVGFSLPLGRGGMARWVRRGVALAVAGIALNVVVFPDEPAWRGRVLQTIALSVVLLGPAVPLLRRPAARVATLAVAALAYVAYVASSPALNVWLGGHPGVAEVLFREFPPWPWLGVPLAGAALGWAWLERRGRGDGAERRLFTALAAIAATATWAYAAIDWSRAASPPLGFTRDVIVNDCWTPGAATLLLVAGGLALVLALAWWLTEVRRMTLRSLGVLGRAALMLYLLHHVVVVTAVSRGLGWRADGWIAYVAANVLLVVALVAVARVWRSIGRGGAWSRGGQLRTEPSSSASSSNAAAMRARV